jgi:hypothetical protein
MKPYISLGFYRPKRWNAREIGMHLVQMAKQAGFVPHDDPAHGPLKLTGKNWSSVALHAEVRRRTFKTAQAESFHYDGDLEPLAKTDCWIILWASNTPTWIKWRFAAVEGIRVDDTLIYKPKSYELIAFENIRCLHRRPPNCPRMRWIFRQRAQKHAL